MTNEPNTEEKPTTENTQPPSKLLIDRPTDFRFHAAYLIYSNAWDKNDSTDIKTKLNEAIEALSNDKIDYENFYREVNQYRAEFNPEHFEGGRGRGGSMGFIETQRKRDWRQREEKARRNARHGR
jgi:hypothetical protein